MRPLALSRFLPLAIMGVLCGGVAGQAQIALVGREPTLEGRIEGSVQVMDGDDITLNSKSVITGDLLVAGTPRVRLNGNPTFGGTVEGPGSSRPTAYSITLNRGSSLGRLVRRTDPVKLPAVPKAAPSGSRSVTLNGPRDPAGNFATLRNLTVSGNVGAVTVPSGDYGEFTLNGSNRLVLGVADSTTPLRYSFKSLELNGTSKLEVVGPVTVTLAEDLETNGTLGNPAHPEWLALGFSDEGLSLEGNARVYAYVNAPDGTVEIKGNAQLIGGLIAKRLVVEGSGLLRLVAPNQRPSVNLTSPLAGTIFTAPAAFTLAATATDADGAVAKVEFLQGTAKLGEDTTAPFTQAVAGLMPGNYRFTARATDNLGATTETSALDVTVVAANRPPTVTLTAPADGAQFTAPATATLTASASDPEGALARVEFYQGATRLGEATAAPFTWPVSLPLPGNYSFSARAYDAGGLFATSATISVSVSQAYQPPTVVLTAPANGTALLAPATLTLAASATGSVSQVEFLHNGVVEGADSSAPFNLTISGLGAGTHEFKARVTDTTGATAISAAVLVSVANPNSPPRVALTAPTANQTYRAPANLGLAATATDLDGTLARVEFFADGAKLGESLIAPYLFNWTAVAAGTYRLTARATDNSGASTDSAPVLITIAPNSLPFLANFEPAEGYLPGPLDGQNGWSVTGQAVVDTGLRYAGAQGVSVAPAASASLLVRAFANADPSVTFVDLFALPAANASPGAGVFLDTDAASVALAATGSGARLQALQGDGAGGGAWEPAGPDIPLDATGRSATWQRITLRMDYAAHKWDLYLNGRMVAADLGFIRNDTTAFTGLGLSGHQNSVTGFDDLLVAFEHPLFVDADHDGMEDTWEIAHGLNPAVNDRNADNDGDGISNVREYLLGTNPAAADSDGDGIADAREIALGTNPGAADTDGDGLPDGWEQANGLNPLSATDATLDGDGDGNSNLAEYQAGTDPADYYNGVLPTLTSQVAADGTLGPGETLSIRVTDAAGHPLVNAPVRCTASVGGHLLSLTPDGPASTVVTAHSDETGLVTVYVRIPGS